MDENSMKAGAGFTLVEMMVAVVVVAVLAALALPSFSTLIATQRLKAASFDLQTALWLAKNEAIKQRLAGGVELQKLDSSGTWADGWRVVAGGVTLLQAARLNGIQVTTPLSSKAKVVFRRDGRLENSSSSNSMGSDAVPVEWRLAASSNPTVAMRCVTIDLSGMISIRVDKDGDTSNGC